MPARLSELTFFYTNSPAWRAEYGVVASPFRDCLDIGQPRCPSCLEEWAQHHPAPVATVAEVRIWIATYQYIRTPPNMPGALLYAKSRSFGHLELPPHTWVEVMRHRQDSEGMDSFGEPGSHEFEGCFFRPAKGSGIWIYTGATFHAGSDGRLRHVIQHAIDEQFDSVQWLAVAFDDGAPMLVVTMAACHSLSRATDPDGIGTCLPESVEVRAGWYDVPCSCNDEWASLNCVGLP